MAQVSERQIDAIIERHAALQARMATGDMSPADFSQVKSTMNLAHVDPDKAAPFISDETTNMSASDWNSLARDLDLAGIDIKRKKNC